MLIPGNVSDRYSQLETMIAERSNLLQTALTESHSVQDGLESLLAWLDTTESTLDRLQNRTSVTLRKEPLNDQMQQYKVQPLWFPKYIHYDEGHSILGTCIF